MSECSEQTTRQMLEQLYDTAFKEGYKKAYEEITPLLRAANEKFVKLASSPIKEA